METGMRLFKLPLFAAIALSAVARATLPVAAISTMSMNFYGMYTTSDATCQTNLVATIPLSATPTVQNFVSSPTLGSGPVASPINCIITVMADQSNITWAAGAYTTTTTGGGGTFPDSGCNAGGTVAQKICRSTSPNYPAKVTADALAVGLTLATSCPASPTGTEVIPIYLSTDAACTGQSAIDAGVTACAGGNLNAFQAPTAANDGAHGIKLTQLPGAGGTYTFTIGVSGIMGGESGGTCGNVSPSIMTITQ